MAFYAVSKNDFCPVLRITVHSCKYDGRIQRLWHARLKRLEGSLIVLEGTFAEEINHPILGTIAEGTLSTEYFWSNRWYGIFCFRERSGQLRNFYCNINTPARLENGILSFIDLDYDVLVRPDFSFQLLDEDEFEANALEYNYPALFRKRAKDALDEIVSLIEGREFPFSNCV